MRGRVGVTLPGRDIAEAVRYAQEAEVRALHEARLDLFDEGERGGRD